MSKHMTIINLACTITKLRKWGEAWKHSAESAQAATARMHQAHEAKMVEHRAAFGARTEADRKIIAGLREEVKRLQWENATMHKDAEDGYAEAIKVLGDPIALSKERDALRAEVAALQERLRASIARGDFAQMEIVALKSQTPKQHGRWVRATSEKCMHGEVVSVRGYLVRTNSGEFLWEGKDCEPCDPPATHDTPEGRSVAEAVIRDSQSRDINDGDLVEVVSNTGRNTWLADVGSVGTVTSIETINDSISVYLDDVPGKKNVLAGYVSLCDVRKVMT